MVSKLKESDRPLWERLSALAKSEGVSSEARRLRNLIASGEYSSQDRREAVRYCLDR